jgi:hypothetical protein
MTSPSLSDLEQAVQRVIDAGRLGKPSVVRWFAHAGPDGFSGTLEAMTAASSRWLGGEPSKVNTFGSEKAGQVVSSVTWPGGQNALLTVAAGSGAGTTPQLNDLIVLGSRGALYHDLARLTWGVR